MVMLLIMYLSFLPDRIFLDVTITFDENYA